MQRDISKLASQEYDLLVIGGGINGAAIANIGAYNGLKVALVEKNDFASGTSSKSTKLIHGGLRYLENLELDLVREALLERYLLVRQAPHLVKPIRFVIPVYKSDRPFWFMRLGVWLYDLLCTGHNLEEHKALNRKDMAMAVPAIKDKDLIGGLMYSDAQMDDARLCLENVLSARAQGATVANYVDVKSLIIENAKTVGVKAWDIVARKPFEIKAKKIICALGPWTNTFTQNHKEELKNKVRTTKGVHLLVRGKVSQHAVLLQVSEDKRIFFIIPWMGGSLIGTTDTDFTKNPDEVRSEEEDVQYLIKHIQRFFPHADFSKENIVTTFAGLRPLVYSQGHPSAVSRKHVIEESPSGIVYVMGGKYTTYRQIAEDALDKVIKNKTKDSRHGYPLFGSGEIKEQTAVVAANYDMSASTVEHLMNVYGARYKDVLSLVSKDADLKEPICDCSPTIKAQVIYAFQTELAATVDDIYARRLNLVYKNCPTKNCRKTIERMAKI